MGLLDSITGQKTGGVQGVIVSTVMSFITNQNTGGLGGLVKQFAGSGLGDIVNSWVGKGENLPVTPQQIQQGLGSETINQLAAKGGISPEEVTSHLTQILPQVADKLTPDGQIPQGNLMSKGIEMLKGLMK